MTEAGEELRVFAQQTLLQYQQLRHTDQQGPSLSGELHIFCPSPPRSCHLLPGFPDRFRAEHPSVEIKPPVGDAADAMDKVVTGEADLAIKLQARDTARRGSVLMLENLTVEADVPALPLPGA